MSCEMAQPAPQPEREEPEEQTAPAQELTRAAILSLNDHKLLAVDVPEWGGRIWMKSINGRQREHHTQMHREKQFETIRAYLICCTACDSEGTRLFKDSDVDTINDKNAEVIFRLYTAALTVSGFFADDTEQKKS